MKKTTQSTNINKTATLAACLLSLATSTALHADDLAIFDMETNGARQEASTTGTGLSVSDLLGNNLNAPGSFTLGGVDAADDYIAWSRSAGSAQTEVIGTIADQTYFSFTLTPDAGQSLNLDTISFDAAAGTGGPSDRQFYIFSDKTGFVSASLLTSASTVDGGGSAPFLPYNTTTSDQNFSVALSDTSALQGISDSVTFRFYIATPTTFQNVGFDDITVTGTVVPEPSSFAVIAGILALGFTATRRRK